MRAQKIAYNTVMQIGGKFVGFFISSFFLIILANKLGTDGMGIYTTVTAFVAFFINLADLGINIVMMRELAQNPSQRETITSEFYGFRLIYGFVIMALAPLLAMLFPQYDTVIVVGIAIAAMAQFILLINQTFVSVLQVSLRLDRAVLAEIVNRLVTLGLVVWAAYTTGDVIQFFYRVMWITVIAAFVNAVLSYIFARRQWMFAPRFVWHRYSAILALVIPMGIFSFLGMVHFKSDTLILSWLKPSYDVGIYGYAYKIGEIMFSLPLIFVGIVFPQMSALYKEDKAAFRDFTQKAFQVLLVITFPFVVGVYLFAPYLTTLLSRQSVADGLIAGVVLQILAIAMVAWFFGALFQHILLAGTDYKGLIRNLAIAVAINVILNFIFIPRYSYYAAATVTAITEFIMLVLTVVYVRRRVHFVAKLDGIIPIILATAVMAGVVVGVANLMNLSAADFGVLSRPRQLLYLIAWALVGAISYGVCLLAWGKQSPVYTLFQMVRK